MSEWKIQFADIEICSHCNARCIFCPVSRSPLPRRIMTQETFALVLQKLQPVALQWVTFNHYNEPLLDNDFLWRASLLTQYKIKLRLYTNAIGLVPRLARQLSELQVIESIVVNIPSADPQEYRRLMGIPMPPTLLDNIQAAVDCGLWVRLCINGPLELAMANKTGLMGLVKRDSSRRCDYYLNHPHDRAGLLKNPMVRSKEPWRDILHGCQRISEHVHVTVEGKVFLCCQDYYQKHIWGNLMVQSLQEIWESPQVEHYRQWIQGSQEAPSDFICRQCVELRRICTVMPKLDSR